MDRTGCVTLDGHLLAADFVADAGEALRSNLPPVSGLEAASSFGLNESICGEKAALRLFCPTSRSGSKIAVDDTCVIVGGGLASGRLGVRSLEPTNFDWLEIACGAIIILPWRSPSLRSLFDFLPDFFAGTALRLFASIAGAGVSSADAFTASLSLTFARGAVLFVDFGRGRFR